MKQTDSEMTLEEAKIAIRAAQEKKKIEDEKATLFGILWVGLGGLFAVLFDDVITGGLTGLICAGVYAFGLHGRKRGV